MNQIYLATDGASKVKNRKNTGSGIVIQDIDLKLWTFTFKNDTYSIENIRVENNDNVILPKGYYNIIKSDESDNEVIYIIQDYPSILFIITKGANTYPLTNNRAEYLAYILGNLILTDVLKLDNWELVTDSELLKNTLQIWMKNWIKNNLINTKKNPDLLKIFNKLKTPELIHHINSHLTPIEISLLSDTKKIHAKLNNKADEIANNAAYLD